MWTKGLRTLSTVGRRVAGAEVTSVHHKSTAASADVDSYVQTKPFEDIPGPKGRYSIPSLGMAFFLKPFGQYTPETLHLLFDELHDKYGPIIKLGLFGTCVVTSDTDTFSTVMQNEGKYPYRGFSGGIMDVYGKKNNKEKGMAVLNGKEWHDLRSAVQKYTLKVNSASIYVGPQAGVASDFVTRIAARNFTPEEFRRELFKFATESIGVVCFNHRLGSLDPDFTPPSPEVDSYLKAVKRFFELFNADTPGLQLYKYFPTKFYREFEKAANTTYSFGREQIKINLDRIDRQIKDGTFDPEEPNLILQLKSNPNITVEGVNAMLLDLLAGGSDSTAKTLESFLLSLAQNPDKQEKLYEEIEQVVGEKGELEAKHYNRMIYYKACAKESFRVRFPTALGVMRQLPHEVILGGYQLPKETVVFVNSRRACMDEKYFDSPNQFIPERWLRDSERKRREDIPALALVPFGMGLRNCIGRRFAEQELWLGVTKIIQHFKVSLGDANKNYDMIYQIFGHAKEPVDFRFTPR